MPLPARVKDLGVLKVSGESGKFCIPVNKIALSGRDRVARGNDRAVYFHPDYPDVLFKVLLDLSEIRLKGFRGCSLRMFPSTRMRAIFKEFECYVMVQTQVGTAEGDLPIPRMLGFVETDLGSASIVERIQDGAGVIGPNLLSMRESGAFGREHVPLLNDFAQRLLSWKVRTTDMNMLNVSYGIRDGRPQFVLVDGIGDNFAIPIRTWSERAMKRGHSRSFAKIARHFDLVWDPVAHRFVEG